jgi:hypothetical protein
MVQGGIHGATHAYRAANGVLYVGGNNDLLRSTDNALTLVPIGGLHTQDGKPHRLFGQLGGGLWALKVP